MVENKPKVDWKPEDIFRAIHDDVKNRLAEGRAALKNPVTKGTASERTWIKLLRRYLPKRYRVASAHVVDNTGKFSDQIDAVIYDRHYSPPIFSFEGQLIIPAESVYAVFEIRQKVNASNIEYAKNKVRSVRSLDKTNGPVFYCGKVVKPKWSPPKAIGGILTLDSEWSDASLESNLKSNLKKPCKDGTYTNLDIGCIAEKGYFISEHILLDEFFDGDKGSWLYSGDMSTTAFLFSLISALQRQGTVPAIDMHAYKILLERCS